MAALTLEDVLSTLTCWAGLVTTDTVGAGALIWLITLSGAGARDTESPGPWVIRILVLDTDLDTDSGARNFRSNISISFSDRNNLVKQAQS